MSKKRYVDTKFWDDNYIIEKDPIEKLLFLYLLTNTLTNIIGIYEISTKRIAFDTGIDKEMVLKILERFEADNKIKYEDGWVIIKNFTKHQLNNPKINAGMEALFKKIPEYLIKWSNIDYDRLSHLNLNTNTNTNTNSKEKIHFDYKKGKFIGITKSYISDLTIKYPNCNINKELDKMQNWLLDNQYKKRQGKRTFINNWLEKSNNKPNNQSSDKDNLPELTDHLKQRRK